MLHEFEALATSWGAYAFVVLLGVMWGSFANVCVYRWPPSDEFPAGRSVVKPPSHCFACKTPIRWYDNVPILSWLWLRGACRTCKTSFSPRYLVVEAVTGLLFGVAWYAAVQLGVLFEPLDARLVRFGVYAAFSFVMVVITFIDLDHKLILNKVTIPSIVVFYVLGLVVGRTWYHGLIGAAVGYGVPWTIGEVYYRITGREGLGLGDSMLLAVIGALLGWKGVLVALFGGSVVGSVIGVAAIVIARRGEGGGDASLGTGTGMGAGTGTGTPTTDSTTGSTEEGEGAEDDDDPGLLRAELPFGPFLAFAALVYLFAEPWIQLDLRF